MKIKIIDQKTQSTPLTPNIDACIFLMNNKEIIVSERIENTFVKFLKKLLTEDKIEIEKEEYI